MRDAAEPRLDSLAYSLARYREVRPALAFRDDAGWKAEARNRLRTLIGLDHVESAPDLAPAYGPVKVLSGYTRRSVVFQTRRDMAAFGHLLVPDGLQGRSPAVVCLPGHGRGADEIVGIDDEGKDREHLDGYQHDFAVQCVRHGYVTLALEMIGFGHRRDPAARKVGAGHSSCQPAAGAALMLGETMVGWRAWDALRALDLLATLPEVAPDRLAMMGISGGGTVILYAAALDDRVKVSVLSGSFCTFRDSIFSIAHCIDNYVPGILASFEAADLAGLIAPRYLFCESGLRDDIFPEAGVREALKDAGRIYQAVGVPDHIDHAFFDSGHQFDGKRAFERLKEWL